MKSTMSQELSLSQQLKSLARESTVKSLEELSRLKNVVVEDFDPALPVYGHWMSFILISGESLGLVFKVHYTTAAARHFAALAFDIDESNCTQMKVIDFMKEYCNISAGSLKSRIETADGRLGVSLPSTTRGFDEIFFRRNKNTITDRWSLKAAEARFICSIDFEILDPSLFADGLTSDSGTTPSGEIDFF